MSLSRLKKAASALYSKRYLRRSLLLSAIAFLMIWLAFFDSHSIAKRMKWSREAAKIERENEAFRQKIAELERQLDTDLSDEVIEQQARERYGMRKEGETVYRIEDIH